MALEVVVWIKNQEQMWEVFLMEDRANFIDGEELEEGRSQFGHVNVRLKCHSRGAAL